MTASQSRRTTRSLHERWMSWLVPAALFVAPAPAQALLANGESATDIFGQFTSLTSDTTVTYTKGCANNGASSIGFNYPEAVAIDSVNHRLFLADSQNHRVLVFTLTAGNLLSSKTPANVLGQPDFTTC